tara:strand:- start:220 stop:465 length:246 start_codon:yes stop_codon:yes gene_type:complete
MKSIDIKSLFTGVMLCAVIFITIGAGQNESKRFSGFSSTGGSLYMIDSQTGDLWKFKLGYNNYYWNKWTSDDPFKPKSSQK